MNKNMKKALAIDGNSLMYRMFYATKNLSDYAIQHNLTPVNAVKLMIETIMKLKGNNYDYCLIAFDHGKKTLRHSEFKDYKLGRKKMPEELVIQIPLIKQSLQSIGINILSMEGIEADDLIGTFAKVMKTNNIHTDIYSSDKDMLQLVSDGVYVHLIKTGLSNVIINTIENFVHLNNGLKPEQIIDFKAIAGDSSDNLPGIKGIGEKTSITMLNEYFNLENIYKNINKFSPTIQKKLTDSKEIAFMCKKIATIDCDVKNDIFAQLDNFLFKPIKTQEIQEFLQKYKINGLEKYFRK